jgi:hypothetical protein
MKNTKWLNGIFVCALAACVWLGCSNSSSPAPSYSLNLTLAPTINHPIFDTLQFQVTKNGKNLAGASLISVTYPYYIQTKAGTSDSNGKFPSVLITLGDSNTEIAYSAVFDTFTSNYVYFPPE